MDGLSLGIDTSNYTTSIAVADTDGEVVYEKGSASGKAWRTRAAPVRSLVSAC